MRIELRTLLLIKSAALEDTSVRALRSSPHVAPTFPKGVHEDHWKPDRPDPYVCGYLGLNGCWAPSEPSEGPPYSHSGIWPERSKKCVVRASQEPKQDDAPAILQAFRDCQSDAHVIFSNTTYVISSIMNTTGLEDVSIEILGTLLWDDTNIEYWIKHSMSIGFQNQNAAWHIGGNRIHMYGHGYGTLDGNGQTWYDLNEGVSNRHGRPHAILITDTKNSVIEGLRFIKGQMWTLTVARSERVLLQDIYVNNTSEGGRPFHASINTDGVDTVYANNITVVDNGDDAISMKQNSTNIYIADCEFYNGESLAMGSIGQYPGQWNVIENITAENIKVVGATIAGRVKTWTGLHKGAPPNGGGGGLGRAKNITFRNFQLENVNLAWGISQCTSYNHQNGDCETSHFQISDMHWGNANGTLRSDRVATLQCSEAAPCPGVVLKNNTFWALDKDAPSEAYLCENVVQPHGFNCTQECGNDCPH